MWVTIIFRIIFRIIFGIIFRIIFGIIFRIIFWTIFTIIFMIILEKNYTMTTYIMSISQSTYVCMKSRGLLTGYRSLHTYVLTCKALGIVV